MAYSVRRAGHTWAPPLGVDHTPYHQDLDRMYRALANPTRRRILHNLGNGTGSTTELAINSGVSPQTVCHHMKVLHEASLLQWDARFGHPVPNKAALEAICSHIRHFF